MKEITQEKLDLMRDRDSIAWLVWLRWIKRGEARIIQPGEVAAGCLQKVTAS